MKQNRAGTNNSKISEETIDDQGNITKSKKVKNIFPVTQHIPVEARLVESLLN